LWSLEDMSFESAVVEFGGQREGMMTIGRDMASLAL
jgi:hypothetical protein